MSEKKMIVIGAGIAGLAAGCYAQMNGYDTTIVEMHDKPARLETRFPGISAQVEMVDVSTPLTVERFTGNWRGIISPWPAADGMKVMVKGLSRTLPGLAQFYMVGQWAEGMIGISTVAVSARKAMQTICKQDGKKFKTTKV